MVKSSEVAELAYLSDDSVDSYKVVLEPVPLVTSSDSEDDDIARVGQAIAGMRCPSSSEEKPVGGKRQRRRPPKFVRDRVKKLASASSRS